MVNLIYLETYKLLKLGEKTTDWEVSDNESNSDHKYEKKKLNIKCENTCYQID